MDSWGAGGRNGRVARKRFTSPESTPRGGYVDPSPGSMGRVSEEEPERESHGVPPPPGGPPSYASPPARARPRKPSMPRHPTCEEVMARRYPDEVQPTCAADSGAMPMRRPSADAPHGAVSKPLSPAAGGPSSLYRPPSISEEGPDENGDTSDSSISRRQSGKGWSVVQQRMDSRVGLAPASTSETIDETLSNLERLMELRKERSGVNPRHRKLSVIAANVAGGVADVAGGIGHGVADVAGMAGKGAAHMLHALDHATVGSPNKHSSGNIPNPHRKRQSIAAAAGSLLSPLNRRGSSVISAGRPSACRRGSSAASATSVASAYTRGESATVPLGSALAGNI